MQSDTIIMYLRVEIALDKTNTYFTAVKWKIMAIAIANFSRLSPAMVAVVIYAVFSYMRLVGLYIGSPPQQYIVRLLHS